MSRRENHDQQSKKYAIRKFAVGTASVLIGSALLTGVTGEVSVSAQTISGTDNLLAEKNQAVSEGSKEQQILRLEAQKNDILSEKAEVEKGLEQAKEGRKNVELAAEEVARLENSLDNLDYDNRLAQEQEGLRQVDESLANLSQSKEEAARYETALANVEKEIEVANEGKAQIEQSLAEERLHVGELERYTNFIERTKVDVAAREAAVAEAQAKLSEFDSELAAAELPRLQNALDNLPKDISAQIAALEAQIEAIHVKQGEASRLDDFVRRADETVASLEAKSVELETAGRLAQEELTSLENSVASLHNERLNLYAQYQAATTDEEREALEAQNAGLEETLTHVTALKNEKAAQLSELNNAYNANTEELRQLRLAADEYRTQILSQEDSALLAAELPRLQTAIDHLKEDEEGRKQIEAAIEAIHVKQGESSRYDYFIRRTTEEIAVLKAAIAQAETDREGVSLAREHVRRLEQSLKNVDNTLAQHEEGKAQILASLSELQLDLEAAARLEVTRENILKEIETLNDAKAQIEEALATSRVKAEELARYDSFIDRYTKRYNDLVEGQRQIEEALLKLSSQVTSPVTTTKPTQTTTSQSVSNVVSESKEKTKEEVTTANVTSSEGGNSSQASATQSDEVLPNTGEAMNYAIFSTAALAILAGVGLVVKKEEERN